MRQTSVAQLFNSLGNKLSLKHVSGDLSRVIQVTEKHVWASDLIGHLNLIHPAHAQVIGEAELAWAERQPTDRMTRYLGELIAANPPFFVIADGAPIPPSLFTLSQNTDVALLTSPQSSASVIDLIRTYLARELAEKTELHGVLMDVLGLGVLITGDSGAGKSELALELLSRGHGLVADDVVVLSCVAPNVIEGRAPPMLKDMIEVRGVGALNIRTIFGETACRRKMRLRLVAHMAKRDPCTPDPLRLQAEREYQNILGVPIPRVTLPVAVGRNLAVLLEAAVRSTILYLRGIDATQDFILRQRQILDRARTLDT